MSEKLSILNNIITNSIQMLKNFGIHIDLKKDEKRCKAKVLHENICKMEGSLK
jgi:hypothetical protein